MYAVQWARSPARAVAGAALILLVAYGLYWSLLRWSDEGEKSFTQGPAQSFWAKPATREAQLSQAITGFIFFILFHELGHGLVDVLQLPAVGPEENVVDEFAAITLISLGREGGIGPQIATSAAIGFARMWELSRGQAGADITKLPYWDEHPLFIQRFYNIICLVYGSAPDQFAGLLEVVKLPETEAQRWAQRCVIDYQRKAQAWSALLSNHLRSPGQSPPLYWTGRIQVRYGPTQSEAGKALEQQLRRSRAYETLAAMLSALFSLPYDIPITLTDCGQENAFWDPEKKQLTICYEMIVFASKLFQQERAEPRPGPGPAPPSDPAPAPPTPASPLIGVWRGQSRNTVGTVVNTETTLNANQTYTHVQWTDAHTQVRLAGQYSVTNNMLRFEVFQQQVCDAAGCRASEAASPLQVPFRLVDESTLQTEFGMYKRVQGSNR
jgi:hypothetical protein